MTGKAPSAEGGNVYDKYRSRHPVERRLVQGFLTQLDRLVEETGATDVHEIGCGEGELVLRLASRGLRVRGSDVSASVVEQARERARAAGLAASFEVASVQGLQAPGDAAELIVCCEVLEHLEDPAQALDVIAGLTREWAIVSVPREPLWRVLNLLRLAYVGDLGNTPGHLHHWSRASFLAFLEERFEVVEVRSPIPWTMVLCRSRRG
jgi:2-polyprenyl-3-methyl-5-hydroxy-6-metoxy-1,4-benzoquinol methylase